WTIRPRTSTTGTSPAARPAGTIRSAPAASVEAETPRRRRRAPSAVAACARTTSKMMSNVTLACRCGSLGRGINRPRSLPTTRGHGSRRAPARRPRRADRGGARAAKTTPVVRRARLRPRGGSGPRRLGRRPGAGGGPDRPRLPRRPRRANPSLTRRAAERAMDTATREEILARYLKHVERFEGAGRKRRPRAVAPAQPEPEKPATTTLSSREVEVLQ